MKIFLALICLLAAKKFWGQQFVKRTDHATAEQMRKPNSDHFTKPDGCYRLQIPANKEVCMTAQEIDFYKQESIAAKQRWLSKLTTAGKPIPGSNRTESHTQPLLNWPLRVSPQYDMQYKYYYKGNFVDQFRGSTNTGDYFCGNRTYDQHDASDISLWPFWWRMMDNQYVSVVAADSGTIILKVDGGDDRHCDANAGGISNRIQILHDDGSWTRYHHLKLNSLTTKDSGDRVQRGEFLGYVGSSGNSSNPHLHFVVHDHNDNLIEPFSGSCNALNGQTWWNIQPVYWDSRVNRVMTHGNYPALGLCESNEIVNAKNNFDPGDPLYVGIAFSENQDDDLASYSIIKPNGSTFTSWVVSLPSAQNREYAVDIYTLPSGNTGTWKIEVNYRNNNYYHYFTVGCPSSVTVSGTQTGPNGYIAGSTINSTGNHSIGSGDKVLYQAATEIIFSPGFAAPNGIKLMTRLAGCNYAD